MFAQEGQPPRKCVSGMSALRSMPETSSFLFRKSQKELGKSHHRKYDGENKNDYSWRRFLPRLPWPKSNLEIPSRTRAGKGAISWNGEKIRLQSSEMLQELIHISLLVFPTTTFVFVYAHWNNVSIKRLIPTTNLILNRITATAFDLSWISLAQQYLLLGLMLTFGLNHELFCAWTISKHSLLVSATPPWPRQKVSAFLGQWTFCQVEMSRRWTSVLLRGSTLSAAGNLGQRTSEVWWISRNRPACDGPPWCSGMPRGEASLQPFLSVCKNFQCKIHKRKKHTTTGQGHGTDDHENVLHRNNKLQYFEKNPINLWLFWFLFVFLRSGGSFYN